MDKTRVWVLRDVGDEFRKRCAELDIPAPRKLESLLIRWQARGMPDLATDINGSIGADWPSERLTRFTLRREYQAPVQIFTLDTGQPQYKVVTGIITEYLEDAGT